MNSYEWKNIDEKQTATEDQIKTEEKTKKSESKIDITKKLQEMREKMFKLLSNIKKDIVYQFKAPFAMFSKLIVYINYIVAKIYRFFYFIDTKKIIVKENVLFESKLKDYVGSERNFAFCLTDIVGSTQLWNDMEHEMQLKLREHSRLGFKIVRKLDGYVSKMEGDSFFVAFETYEQAIEFGNRIIKANKKCKLSPKVKIRVGVSYGMSSVGFGINYMFRGEAVKKVYELNDIAKPNTILCDKSVICKHAKRKSIKNCI